MSAQKKASFGKARQSLVKALAEYQTATRDMNHAILRCVRHTHAVCGSMQSMVNASGTLLARRH